VSVRTVCLAFAIALSTISAVSADTGRIVLLNIEDDAYREIAGEADEDGAGAELRLLVVSDDRVVAEHPLARSQETSTERDADGELLRIERVASDEAWITESASAAVIARTRYTTERPFDDNGRVDPDRIRFRSREVSIEWIDLEQPGGRWREVLPDGSAVGAVHLLDSARGVGVVVTRGDSAEFLVLNRDGRILTLQRGLIATNPVVRVSPDGTVLAVDLAYESRAGLPDRAVHVVDLKGGGSWSYPWTYGSDREPLSWDFDVNGDLLFETADMIYRYRPDGRPGRTRHRR
jgi:hypothetical protein